MQNVAWKSLQGRDSVFITIDYDPRAICLLQTTYASHNKGVLEIMVKRLKCLTISLVVRERFKIQGAYEMNMNQLSGHCM